MSIPSTWRRPRLRFAELANGAVLSPEVLSYGEAVVGLVIGTGFTGSLLTFEVWDAHGETWRLVHGPDGSAVTIFVAAGRYIAMPPHMLPSMDRFRMRSNLTQSGAAMLQVLLRAYA